MSAHFPVATHWQVHSQASSISAESHLFSVWGRVCQAHALLAAVGELLRPPGDLVKPALACTPAPLCGPFNRDLVVPRRALTRLPAGQGDRRPAPPRLPARPHCPRSQGPGARRRAGGWAHY